MLLTTTQPDLPSTNTQCWRRPLRLFWSLPSAVGGACMSCMFRDRDGGSPCALLFFLALGKHHGSGSVRRALHIHSPACRTVACCVVLCVVVSCRVSVSTSQPHPCHDSVRGCHCHATSTVGRAESGLTVSHVPACAVIDPVHETESSLSALHAAFVALPLATMWMSLAAASFGHGHERSEGLWIALALTLLCVCSAIVDLVGCAVGHQTSSDTAPPLDGRLRCAVPHPASPTFTSLVARFVAPSCCWSVRALLHVTPVRFECVLLQVIDWSGRIWRTYCDRLGPVPAFRLARRVVHARVGCGCGAEFSTRAPTTMAVALARLPRSVQPRLVESRHPCAHTTNEPPSVLDRASRSRRCRFHGYAR